MHKISIKPIFATLLAAAALAGCNPAYNWRDYTSQDARYRVLFPDKPASYTRSVDLDGMPVQMTMTAARAGGATFAVGSAEAPDAAKSRAALVAMKTALVRNIGATVTKEKASSAASANGSASTQRAAIDIEASGSRDGVPMRLVGHFEARDKRFYQVIVMGTEKSMSAEQTETFLSSFKLL